jgi:hypothetical protein
MTEEQLGGHSSLKKKNSWSLGPSKQGLRLTLGRREWDLHSEVLLSESLDPTASLSHALTAAEETSSL